eukprot:CAMPEP_0115622074 /NCGR_PEP_ID=MMETSP0272-20121206/26061_1 /TAXON_ID=71861 /ORGANISM="Scrippsiella trochoidea, Strain CCMP3099" /LENGTH=84 /DNA_ID=CAMNT_0003058227 /DNA_START=1151 /DNA_END=1405 /DNA_ORIENTATION=+
MPLHRGQYRNLVTDILHLYWPLGGLEDLHGNFYLRRVVRHAAMAIGSPQAICHAEQLGSRANGKRLCQLPENLLKVVSNGTVLA